MIMKSFSSSSSSVLFISLLTLLSVTSFTFCSSKVVVVDGLKNYHELKFPGNITGPESLAFDCHGDGPYTGVSDGRILKWEPTHKTWIEFAVTSPHRDGKLCDGSSDAKKEPLCGRPLGLQFDRKTCDLYIADAYFGLLVVGPNGGVAQQLATSADDGVPFKFLNALDVDDQTGVVYFSDSSSVYQKSQNTLIVQRKDSSGRLMKYDPKSKKVHVLLKDLAFANGVAVSHDASFLLIAELSLARIHKFWLKGSKAYTSELFSQLERPPDNIKRNKKGHFWVGLNSNTSFLQSGVINNNADRHKEYPVGVKFDDKGKILEVLDGRGGQQLASVSEVLENNKRLWVGSVFKPYLVFLN